MISLSQLCTVSKLHLVGKYLPESQSLPLLIKKLRVHSAAPLFLSLWKNHIMHLKNNFLGKSYPCLFVCL